MLATHMFNSRFCLCTSVVPKSMSAVFGLVTRLHVRIRTTLENGILRNGHQPQSVVNGFQSLPVVVGKVYELHIGKALHSAANL